MDVFTSGVACTIVLISVVCAIGASCLALLFTSILRISDVVSTMM